MDKVSKSSFVFILLAKAILKTSLAKATKSSFLATKSVSQLTETIAPNFLSSDTLTKQHLLKQIGQIFSMQLFVLFRNTSIANSKSPLASTKAFLQSIIPAPVCFLNLLTSDAVIFVIF